MQTFLPYSNYKQSAQHLDMRRLGKQRVETLQILNALSNPEYGWQSHPAVKMWKNYELELVQYGLDICEEWINRGYKDTCYQKILDKQQFFTSTLKPSWLGLDVFHQSHRAALYRKAPDLYPTEWEKDLELSPEYWWPTENESLIK